MLKVVQAFDLAPIAEIETDDAAALERKLQAAERAFRDRDGWLKPHQRIAILRKLATRPAWLCPGLPQQPTTTLCSFTA